LTAAIYCQRRELKTLVIAKAIGGQAALAAEVYNWPGEQQIGGFELTQQMNEQAKSWGAEFVSNEVTAIEKTADGVSVKTNSGDYEAGAVILAFGLTPRDLGVPGEEKFKGRGVSYCATCDGPLFKNKVVAIAGGGNAAFEAAEYMAKLASRVYVINQAEKFLADEVIVKQVSALENVTNYCNFDVT
jgi:thioredoxin reductase (NADPH)